MNRKGFTLVELIAMVVVLGIIMTIAVPNIVGVVNNNKKSIAIEDANKLVRNAKQTFQTKKATYPKDDECIFMTLKYLNINDDFTTGVNGGEYDKTQSFVIVKKEENTNTSANQYNYYFRLLEIKGNVANRKYYQMGLTEYKTFENEPETYSSVIKVKESNALITGIGDDDDISDTEKEAIISSINRLSKKYLGVDELCSSDSDKLIVYNQ